MSSDPRPFAKVGSQDRFCMSASDDIRIRHLFVYEDLSRAVAYLQNRLKKKVSLPNLNISPIAATELAPDLEARPRKKRAREFSLYQRVAEHGYLETPGAG